MLIFNGISRCCKGSFHTCVIRALVPKPNLLLESSQYCTKSITIN